METYLTLVALSLLSVFILILLVMKNKTFSQSVKIGIELSAVFVMIGTVSECLGVLLDDADEALRGLHILVKFVELSLAPVIPVAFSNLFYRVKFGKRVVIPVAVHTLLELISAFTGLIYYVDADNHYYHGRFYFIYYLAILMGVSFLIYMAIRYASYFQNRNKLSLVLILLFVLAGTTCQAVNSSLRVTWLSVSIATILFYIYYCNMVLQVDALTQLLNRRSYNNRVLNEKKPAQVLFFDINCFKAVNDRYGHAFGDECLRVMAASLKAVYGKYGLCYRIGGDEFCVIVDRKLSEWKPKERQIAFEKRLDKLREKDSRIPTVAIGCAAFHPNEMTFSEAAEMADQQMYRNKNEEKT